MSYRNLLANLKDVMYRYFDAKDIDTFDKLAEAFIYEQLIAALPDLSDNLLYLRKPKLLMRQPELQI